MRRREDINGGEVELKIKKEVVKLDEHYTNRKEISCKELQKEGTGEKQVEREKCRVNIDMKDFRNRCEARDKVGG